MVNTRTTKARNFILRRDDNNWCKCDGVNNFFAMNELSTIFIWSHYYFKQDNFISRRKIQDFVITAGYTD